MKKAMIMLYILLYSIVWTSNYYLKDNDLFKNIQSLSYGIYCDTNRKKLISQQY